MKAAVILLVPVLIGCDRWLQIEGRIVEGDPASYEVLDSDEELARKAQGETPVKEASIRLIEHGYDKDYEWPTRRFAPFMREGIENGFASWQINPIRNHQWDSLHIESEGYEDLVIPGDQIPAIAFPKRLLIRLKRTK